MKETKDAVRPQTGRFTLTVRGVSAHGSTPHRGKDAVAAASAVVMNLQAVVSRMNNPLEPLVVTVGSVRAGTQFNIIADAAVMEGAVHAASQDALNAAGENLRSIAASTAGAYGCAAELVFHNEPVDEREGARTDER